MIREPGTRRLDVTRSSSRKLHLRGLGREKYLRNVLI
jgi:hypothetical protein